MMKRTTIRHGKKLISGILALLVSFLILSFPALAEEDIDWEKLEYDEETIIEMPQELLLATDLVYHTPGENSPVQCDHAPCYWKLPMGEMNEEAIWEVLTQPVTVLEGSQRNQCRVLARPDTACTDYVGLVTYASQGVHVLERGEEWTLIEAYSSATEGSPVHVYATKFQGYVKTALLKEKTVDQTYGIVIDKQQQRLYLFREGQWLTTMLCSTGYARKDSPWNETPAGEFLMISWTGDFWSGDLFCRRAIRINDGILIHEVPCKERVNEKTGETRWDYSRCERYLGQKASHGCIRVQRAVTPEGISEEWLWKNLPKGDKTGNGCVKVIIWDDAGRTLGYPDDDLKLYYNPKDDKKKYHSQPTCREVAEKYEPMTAFRYGELDEKPYKKLTPCSACAPQPRKSAIDEMNEKNNR